VVAELGAIATPIIGDNMARLFAGGAALRPLHGDARLAGPALTVRTRPGDNLLVHKAIDMIEPGDVLVVDAGGETANAIVGEIMMQIARRRGAAGFVVDGTIRDVDAFREAAFCVFARGVTQRGPYKDGPGEINVPVTIGEMVVHPGDAVVGDADGLVAVPAAEAEDVLQKARAQEAREARMLAAIADDTLDRSWIDETLRAKGYDV
jgi:RraA family protein